MIYIEDNRSNQSKIRQLQRQSLILRPSSFVAFLMIASSLLARPALSKPMPQKQNQKPLLSHQRQVTADVDLVRNSVLRVTVSSVRTDPVRPWVRRAADAYTVIGLVLGNGLIMIQADDIRNAVLIEVSRADSYTREKAKLVLADMEANLAILQIEKPDFLGGLKPIGFGKDAARGDDIIAARTDSLFRVYRETARLIEYNISSDYGFTRLPVFVFSARENYQNGDLLLQKDRLVGIVAYQQLQGKAVAVPVSRLLAFRDRAIQSIKNKSKYAGFVAQGIELDDLVDPDLRSYVGLDDIDQKPQKKVSQNFGAYVSVVLPKTTLTGVLKTGDVLLSLDGQPVDEKGLYRDPLLGLQRAELLLTRDVSGRYRLPGEQVKLEVLRSRKKETLSVTLKEYQGSAERIPWLLSENEPSYLIESGAVFVELSMPYLQGRYGKDWRRRSLQLSYLYDANKYYKNDGDNDRIVVLSEVLPDSSNQGYQSFGIDVVVSVNGKKPNDLTDMIQMIRDAKSKKKLVEVRLEDGSRVYLDPNANSDNQRIKETYHLPALSRP